MFGKTIDITILCGFFFVTTTKCERRIAGGKRVELDRRYMVYIVRFDDPTYKDHICGGSIISKRLVLTAQSCLSTNAKMYAVAGYRKYVPYFKSDLCVTKLARRISRYFSRHRFPNHANTWRAGGIALAEVTPPFDFTDPRYPQYCSYYPTTIPVLRSKAAFHGRRLEYTILGWGSLKYYRPEGYDVNFNEKYLMATTVKYLDSGTCTYVYKKAHPSGPSIKGTGTFCTDGPGFLDANGEFSSEKPNRRFISNTTNVVGNYTHYQRADDRNASGNSNNSIRAGETVEHGPCYNDQGGPIVKWIGGREYVVGVMLSFLVDTKMRCVGPFLHATLRDYLPLLTCATTKIKLQSGDLKYRLSTVNCWFVYEDTVKL